MSNGKLTLTPWERHRRLVQRREREWRRRQRLQMAGLAIAAIAVLIACVMVH